MITEIMKLIIAVITSNGKEILSKGNITSLTFRGEVISLKLSLFILISISRFSS